MREIIEAVANNNINYKLLDRFIKYCKAANVKDIGTLDFGKDTFIYGISDKRFKALVDQFIKANDNKVEFEYDLDNGSTRVTKLLTKYK